MNVSVVEEKDYFLKSKKLEISSSNDQINKQSIRLNDVLGLEIREKHQGRAFFGEGGKEITVRRGKKVIRRGRDKVYVILGCNLR